MRKAYLATTLLAIIFALDVLTVGASHGYDISTTAAIDEVDVSWTWSHATAVTNTAFMGGEARTLRDSGFGACTFTGIGATLYGMTGSSITIEGKTLPFGKVKILIDGNVKDVVSLTTPDTDYSHKICEIKGLKQGKHILEVRAVGGAAVIDCLVPLTDSLPDKPTGIDKPSSLDYSDTFNAGATDWIRYGDNEEITDGHYVINGQAGDKALQSNLSFRDFTYSCDVALSGGNDVGLIFRVTNPQIGQDAYNGYYVGLGNSRQEVVLGRVSGSWTLLASTPFTVRPNVVYTVKVVAIGSKITVYVNDSQIITANDATFPDGGIGVRAYMATGAFSNLHVSRM